jgi:ribonuclease R
MARDLGIAPEDFHDFRQVLEYLRQDGLVIRGKDARWHLAGKAPRPRTVTKKPRWHMPAKERRLELDDDVDVGDKILEGTIDITLSGNAFLLPDNPTDPDVFLSPDAILDAFDGDRVRVVVKTDSRRPYGLVKAVLARANPRVVARILPSGKAVTEDPRNHYEFNLVPSPDAPTRSASQAAKSQRRRRIAGEGSRGDSGRYSTPGGIVEPPPAGQKVLMEVVSWPASPEGPRARIVEILGPAGDPDTETASILAGYNAPGPFPPEVLQAARTLARSGKVDLTTGRLDLTGAVTLTIDPVDARDFDDALSISPGKNGVMIVDVHIADVSHYVQPGTPLDLEARERATSIYLPERVLPMLPEELSNDVCSLRPGEVRPVKTVRLHFDAKGNRTSYSIHRSLIRSRHRFTYEEVRDLLNQPSLGRDFPDPEVWESLQALHELASRIREKRLAHDTVELNLAEYRVVIDAHGLAQGLEAVEHDFSHQLVEEFMLAANRAVAEWAAANGLPVLHRQHPSPKEDRLAELSEYLTASGYVFKPPFNRHKLVKVVAAARGTPEEHAINLMILKSFQQAVYGPDPDIGHFALVFSKYLHFTSPIRRYPDLHLHQMLDRAFTEAGSERLPKRLSHLVQAGEDLAKLGQHTSARERRAMRIEEEVKEFRRLELLSRATNRDYQAVVTGVKKFGVFVEVAGFFVESLLPRVDLARHGFSTRLELPPLAVKDGKKPKKERRVFAGDPGFHIGQTVRVRVKKIDLSSRRLELDFLGLA